MTSCSCGLRGAFVVTTGCSVTFCHLIRNLFGHAPVQCECYIMSPSSVVPPLLRRALRLQRKNANQSALIVLTLALALGANSSVLTVADALLLRAVPFNDPDRLVSVTSAFPSIKLTTMNLSGPEALEFQQLTRAFSVSGPFAFTGLVIQSASEAELANGVRISQGAAAALDVVPLADR